MSSASESGSALSLVVIGLALLAALGAAGFGTARQAHLASVAASHAAAAYHASENALALYESGAGPDTGSFRAVAAPAAVDVSARPLARMSTGEVLVLVVASARSPDASPFARRTLMAVFRVDTLGVRQAREGTWRERI